MLIGASQQRTSERSDGEKMAVENSKRNESWEGDLLGRQKDGEFLIEFLKRRHAERKKAEIKGAYVLNVNAEWGFGKSYLLRGMAEDLREQHPVVLIDAWKNDFSDDPYTMVISEIDAVVSPLIPKDETQAASLAQTSIRALKKNAGKIILAGAKGAAKKIVTKFAGDRTNEITDLIFETQVDAKQQGAEAAEKGIVEEAANAGLEGMTDAAAAVSDDMLDALATRMINDYLEVKDSQEQFRASLGKLLKALEQVSALRLPMFVFIDELDRCRPHYAIGLLERIKHLFDVDDIVFVFATDTVQLTWAITGFYGSNFNGHNYLQRFFSRTYNLPKPKPKDFIETMVKASGVQPRLWAAPGMDGIAFLGVASDCFGLSLRDIERAMEILLDLTTSWTSKSPIELTIMYPYIVSFLKATDIDAWAREPLRKDVQTLGSRLKLGEPFEDIANGITYQPPSLSAYMVPLDQARLTDFYEYVTDMHNRVENTEGAERVVSSYVATALVTEYNVRFGHRVEPGRRSIIAKYPDMIRYAGSLE